MLTAGEILHPQMNWSVFIWYRDIITRIWTR